MGVPGVAIEAVGLDAPVEALPGIGPKTGAALRRRGMTTVADVFRVVPRGYLDERARTPLGALEAGQHAVIHGVVADVKWAGPPFRQRMEVTVESSSEDPAPHGTVRLVWFRARKSMETRYPRGTRVVARGRVQLRRGQWTVAHPQTEVGEGRATSWVPRIRPIYPHVEGVTEAAFAGAVQGAVGAVRSGARLEEWLPPALAKQLGLPSMNEALVGLHAPDPVLDGTGFEALVAGRSDAHLRLAMEEVFLLELCLALQRREEEKLGALRVVEGAPRDAVARFRGMFSFPLTGAQERAAERVMGGLSVARPMRQLLQGDVGSGKTAVALLAARAVAEAGHQTAVLVPTELLAEQHARVFERALEPLGIRVGLLVGGLRAEARRRASEAVARGEVSVVVGTHALLTEGVRFARLALAVVDEQHRFGVAQRLRLVAREGRGPVPHLLVMTATPIPRTLALAMYGDLDLVTLDEMPPGRTPPVTRIYSTAEREQALRQVARALDAGGRAYVVCPTIDASGDEGAGLPSVLGTHAELAQRFPDWRVDMLHGAQDHDTRHTAMERFATGATRVLVSTTVVEVGVDVPEANVIMVEGAERFGLAQLHQLRGRVGRGGQRSACLLVHGALSTTGRECLRALEACHDGFRIAETDLRLRGPGELLGREQSGFLADLTAWAGEGRGPIEAARAAAAAILEADPDLEVREHGPLRRRVQTLMGQVVREGAG